MAHSARFSIFIATSILSTLYFLRRNSFTLMHSNLSTTFLFVLVVGAAGLANRKILLSGCSGYIFVELRFRLEQRFILRKKMRYDRLTWNSKCSDVNQVVIRFALKKWSFSLLPPNYYSVVFFSVNHLSESSFRRELKIPLWSIHSSTPLWNNW